MNDELATWPATRLAAAVRAKEISSRELLDLYLDRIDRLNGAVNAVVTLDVDRARASAAAADKRAAAGTWDGPLHGLPITIKDAIATEGIRSTGGAVELRDHIPTVDAPAVARLKAAGAIVFGKTNLPRWSADVQSYNDLFGTTNNPWDLGRTAGGSSGGAGAAVACGFTSFELGTDIGGSVRIPSHFNGVFGLKPSYGVIPQRGYLDHVDGGTIDADINVFGPLARSAADLELLLGVLAGPVAEDAVGWRLELPAATGASLSDYRIGLWLDDPYCAVDSESVTVLQAMAAAITGAGIKAEESHPAVSFQEQRELFMNLVRGAISPSVSAEAGEQLAGDHRTWLLRQERRAALRAAWSQWFEDHDILLCPVWATAAFPHDHEGDIMSRTLVIDGVTRAHTDVGAWTGLIGIVNLPSAVVPIGLTASGVPCGVQVVAPYLHDRRAIHVAGLIAEVVGGYRVPPG